ncbi:MAG TPA: hypothetical protein PLP23_16010 [Panacibacter sp.]|nr:hypothetical protein [Panacibacter sp.]
MKIFIPAFLLIISFAAKSQKIDSIYFHLYTDSLKRGVHNYINIDAKIANGKYLPLSDKEITFWSNTGTWQGNDLIIDSTYKADSVVIKAVLKDHPELNKTITIYIKKITANPVLKTESEIINNPRKRKVSS